MKSRRFQKGFLFLGGLATVFVIGVGGCTSSPPERPDREKIKQDAEKGMQDLQREEGRHGNTDGY